MLRSFWLAPRIATSGLVQHRKFAIDELSVKSDKSDWLGIQNKYSCTLCLLEKLGPARGRDYWCWPKRSSASVNENGGVLNQRLTLCFFFLASSLSTSFFQIMIMNMRHWTIKNHTGEETLKLKIFFQKSSSYYNYCLKPFNIPIRRAAHRAVSYSKNLGYNINLNLHTWYICSTSDLSGLHQLVRFPNIKQLNIVSC